MDKGAAGAAASTDAGDHGRGQAPSRGQIDPVPGEDWGRYRVESLLGAGGLGRVWRAWDRLLLRPVALKCLVAQDAAAVERLLREARTQARIEHDNVCKVYDAGEVAGRPYIAMQLVAGGSLRDAAPAMGIEQRIEVMRKVAEGVHAAHRTGLIHRDLKPANILVEYGDAGELHPYVADFGVAREAAAPRDTRVGLAVGSVHYMAPEQARAAAIDRRVDVWGLGATLYELLSGQPPCGAGNEAEVLLRLLRGDITPLSHQAPGLPADLQTVVMKCLEPDPARRYDSARALADDLRRYLDGDPVVAQPASRWYRAAKRLRKHRAAAAAGLLVVVALGALGLFAWRAQRRAHESALAAQRFGRQTQEIETTLRIAYLLPLHDTRGDQQRARDRMRQLASQMEQLGDYARGPGHYSLGRGYLALHRLDEANRELKAAWALGYRGPEVSYALGRALTERYQAELEQAAHLGDKDLRQARRQAAERTLLAPARDALAASRGTDHEAGVHADGGDSGEGREYLQALLAVADHRLPQAAQHAARAFAADPAHFEAGLLMGDAHLQLAREARERGDYEGAATWLATGRRDETATAAVARSAPEVHAARCALEAAALDLDWARGRAVEAGFGAVRTACDEALTADPRSPLALAALAQAYLTLGLARDGSGVNPAGAFEAAFAATGRAAPTGEPDDEELLRIRAQSSLRLGQYWMAQGHDPRPWFERARTDAARAVAAAPGSTSSHQELGFADLALGEYQIGQGLDPTPALDRAAASFGRGLAIDPRVANLHHRLAYTLFQRAAYEKLHGRDPRPTLAAAEASYRQTLAINPRTVQAYSNLGNAYVVSAEYELDRGLDPQPALAQAVASYRSALALDPHFASAHQNLGGALLIRAQYEAKAGGDPRPTLDLARQSLRAASALNRNDPDPLSNLATAAIYLGDYMVDSGLDPASVLADGRREVTSSLAMNPNDAEVIRTRAELALVAARWALHRSVSPAVSLEAAISDLRRSLAVNATDAGTWADLAAAEELRCEPGLAMPASVPPPRPMARSNVPAAAGRGDMAASGDSACAPAAARGLEATARALALNPLLAEAERLRGTLAMATARSAKDAATRRQAAATAAQALSRAVALDPLLRSKIMPLLTAGTTRTIAPGT